MDNLMVEFVLKLNKIDKVPEWYRESLKGFKTIEDKDRLIVDVPHDWKGFKDRTVGRMIETMKESLYVALAYVSTDDSEIVTDLEGKKIDKFDEVIDGKFCRKFVKKNLRILKIMNVDDDIFEVKGYVLNLQFAEPVVKVLDLYSLGKKSSVRSGSFYGA